MLQNKTKKSDKASQPVRKQEKYLGRVIGGKYSVIESIYQGDIYSIYIAEYIKNNKRWTIKLYDKMSRYYDSSIRENILREAYTLNLNHPSILNVVDMGENDENIFVVREYVEGVTLQSVVKNCGAQSADKVIEWSKELCNILHYLHNLKPPHIYRDMKPENVILVPEDHLKVVDFCIVRNDDTINSIDNYWLDSRSYNAPEQFGGSCQIDVRTDIFRLGMTMHYLVTGFDSSVLPYTVWPIRKINPDLPKGLEYIISKCIQPAPGDRYQNCDELINDLNNYME